VLSWNLGPPTSQPNDPPARRELARSPLEQRLQATVRRRKRPNTKGRAARTLDRRRTKLQTSRGTVAASATAVSAAAADSRLAWGVDTRHY
jgi:hypothetical protein